MQLWTYQDSQWKASETAPSIEMVAAAELTDCQAKYLNCIANLTLLRGYPPTIRDIQKYLNYSSPAPVQFALHHLEVKGCISRRPGESRGIKLLERFAPVYYCIRYGLSGYLNSQNNPSDRAGAMCFPSRDLAELRIMQVRKAFKFRLVVERVECAAEVEELCLA